MKNYPLGKELKTNEINKIKETLIDWYADLPEINACINILDQSLRRLNQILSGRFKLGSNFMNKMGISLDS